MARGAVVGFRNLRFCLGSASWIPADQHKPARDREASQAIAGFGSRSAFRKEVDAHRFPAPVRISPGRIAWPEGDIAKWQAQKIADRDSARKASASLDGADNVVQGGGRS